MRWHVVVSLPGLEAVEQLVTAQHQRRREAVAQLLAQHLVDWPGAAGHGNHRRGIDAGGREAGDQGAFAVAQQDQLAEARVGLEFAAPGFGVGHVAFHRQIAFVRGCRQARRHTALVVAHAGDVVFGQYPGQALEAVIAPAVGVVAVTIGWAGAGNDQHNRHRRFGFGQQQRAEQLSGAGIQGDRPLQDSGLGKAGNQGKAQGYNSQHRHAIIVKVRVGLTRTHKVRG
ncbi:hypothetical protein D3C76_1144750 [compost metagenome]